jgi:hypothetical protein
MSASVRPGWASPIKILVRGETRELSPGMRTEFQLAPAEAGAGPGALHRAT